MLFLYDKIRYENKDIQKDAVMQKNITGNQNNVSEFLAQWGSFCSDSEASFSAEYEFIYYLKGMKAFLIPYCNGNLRIQKIVERINTILKELEQ